MKAVYYKYNNTSNFKISSETSEVDFKLSQLWKLHELNGATHQNNALQLINIVLVVYLLTNRFSKELFKIFWRIFLKYQMANIRVNTHYRLFLHITISPPLIATNNATELWSEFLNTLYMYLLIDSYDSYFNYTLVFILVKVFSEKTTL